MRHTLLALLVTLPLSALTPEMLLQEVMQSNKALSIEDKKREKRFEGELQEARAALLEMKNTLAAERSATTQLKKRFEANKATLQQLTQNIEMKSASLKALFGDIRQEAKNFSDLLNSAMTSTQLQGREEFLEHIQSPENSLKLEDIRHLWELYFEEIIASGEIRDYQSEVITTQGKSIQTLVTRIGLFSAFDKQHYLRYDENLHAFVTLQRQPDSDALAYIDQYHTAKTRQSDYMIDPTRGVLFSMLKERATISDRIHQGGLIGYVILFIGLLSTLFALYKYIGLLRTSAHVNRQLQTQEADTANPLGRIMAVFEKHENKDLSIIESKLDTAILKELPSIQNGFAMVKLVAAVAPLLGLLGTVTGMIETFQSITLFGTGDPKLMASGISQALMTTVLGLVVAIPTLFIFSLLSSQAKQLINVLTQQSSAMVAKKLDMLPQKVA